MFFKQTTELYFTKWKKHFITLYIYNLNFSLVKNEMKGQVSSKVVLTKKNYLAEAKMRNHYGVLDRPIEEGGGNSGPTPVEYLLTAIAGCVSMTLKVYIERKKLDVGNITVKVSQKEILTPKGIEKSILEEISFEKEVSVSQKKELLRVASKCPVVKMIKGETKVISNII